MVELGERSRSGGAASEFICEGPCVRPRLKQWWFFKRARQEWKAMEETTESTVIADFTVITKVSLYGLTLEIVCRIASLLRE
jgi:hypothetical protein